MTDAMRTIKKQTSLVVMKDGEFLRGLFYYGLAWSTSPYDAWRSRNISFASAVADKLGGSLWLFNPIIGQARQYAK